MATNVSGPDFTKVYEEIYEASKNDFPPTKYLQKINNNKVSAVLRKIRTERKKKNKETKISRRKNRN